MASLAAASQVLLQIKQEFAARVAPGYIAELSGCLSKLREGLLQV